MDKRTQEIIYSLRSCNKETYHKSEMLTEMFNLQKEVAEYVFKDCDCDKSRIKLYEVEKYLRKINEAKNNVAEEELNQYIKSSKELSNCIRSEISGKRGEEIVFSSVGKMRVPFILIKNIPINQNGYRTEIDGVVITRKGLFVIEVKNTKKNIFIDNNGDYYREGNYSAWDSNIKNKLDKRVNLLSDTLEKSGIYGVKINNILVFTNNRIEIKNYCDGINICFSNQLSHIIEDWNATEGIEINDFTIVLDAIKKLQTDEKYGLDFDAIQFKKNFANVMKKLEGATYQKPKDDSNIAESRAKRIFKKIFNRNTLEIIEKTIEVGSLIVSATITVKQQLSRER